MIESNEAGSVLFQDHTSANAEQGAVSNVPIGEDSPPQAASLHPAEKSGSAGMWAALLALAVALVALAGYDYWFLRKTGFSLAELPTLASTVRSLGSRMDALEAQVKDWAAERQALSQELSQTDTRLRDGLAGISAQTRALISEAEIQTTHQLDARTRPLETRLNFVAAREQTDHAQLAQLSSTVGRLRNRLATLQSHQAQTGEEVSGLARRQSQTSARIGGLEHQLQPRQIAFDAIAKQGSKLAPGISFHLTKANVPYQRYSGWIRDHGRIIWVRNQSAQRPLTFYSAASRQVLDLVITQVSKKRVSGFFMLAEPARSFPEQSANNLPNPGNSTDN